MDSDNSHVRTAYAERLERRGDEDIRDVMKFLPPVRCRPEMTLPVLR